MKSIITFWVGRYRAFGYALKGVTDFFKNHDPAKVHILAFVGMALIAWYLDFAMWKWIIFFLCSGLVLATEALNTAIEYIVDLVSPEYHELAGKAKDMAAAAVFFTALFSAIIAGLMIWDEFFAFGV